MAMLAAKARAMQGRLPEDKLKLVAYASDQVRRLLQGRCLWPVGKSAQDGKTHLSRTVTRKEAWHKEGGLS